MDPNQIITILDKSGITSEVLESHDRVMVLKQSDNLVTNLYSDNELSTGFIVFINPSNSVDDSLLSITHMLLLTTLVTNLSNEQAKEVLNYLGFFEDKLPNARSLVHNGFKFTTELLDGLITYRVVDIGEWSH